MCSLAVDENTQPSHPLLAALEEHRKHILAKIREANGITESEALAIGDALRLIVDEARDYVAASRSVLEELAAASLTEMLERHRAAMTAYVKMMQSQVAAQNEAAKEATAQLHRIVELGRTIEYVATESKILALNANIHASRAGSNGDSFKVIAQEMKRFSTSIVSANTGVQDLAEGLLEVLPRIAELALQMQETSSGFTQDIAHRVAEVAATNIETKRQVAATLASGEERLQRIVKHSHDALSHLQFQDPVAQSLLACEGEMHDSIELVERWLTSGHVGLKAPECVDVSTGPSLESGEVMLF